MIKKITSQNLRQTEATQVHIIETNSPQNGELNSSYTKRASELKSSRTQRRKSVQETDTSDTRT